MPYIRQSQRARAEKAPENAGELNFAITKLLQSYLRFTGRSYQAFNDITGALENAKIEFYRRVVTPYEMEKILENGDAY
jgi:Domain of unknown function (DUF6899)